MAKPFEKVDGEWKALTDSYEKKEYSSIPAEVIEEFGHPVKLIIITDADTNISILKSGVVLKLIPHIEGFPRTDAIREISASRSVKNPEYALEYLMIAVNQEATALVMPLGETIPDFERLDQPIIEALQRDWDALKQIWIDMALSVAELHNGDVVHHDIKPQNFVIVNGKYRLMDFGGSFSMASHTDWKIWGVATPTTRPPEKALGEDLYFDLLTEMPDLMMRGDVFSLGITFIYLAIEKHLGTRSMVDFQRHLYDAVLQLLGESLEEAFPKSTEYKSSKGMIEFFEDLYNPLPEANSVSREALRIIKLTKDTAFQLGTLEELFPSEIASLLRGMIQIDPRKRFSIFTVLSLLGEPVRPERNLLQRFEVVPSLTGQTQRNRKMKEYQKQLFYADDEETPVAVLSLSVSLADFLSIENPQYATTKGMKSCVKIAMSLFFSSGDVYEEIHDAAMAEFADEEAIAIFNFLLDSTDETLLFNHLVAQEMDSSSPDIESISQELLG